MYPQRKTKSGGSWNPPLDSYLGAVATISIAITIYRTLSKKTSMARSCLDDEVCTSSSIESNSCRAVGTACYGCESEDAAARTCTITSHRNFTGNTCHCTSHVNEEDQCFWGRMMIQLWKRYVKKYKTQRDLSKNNSISQMNTNPWSIIRSVTFHEERFQASCHCNSIVIILQGIQGAVGSTAMTQDQCGKYPFPYLTVAPECFHLKQGDEFLSLYYDTTLTSRHATSNNTANKTIKTAYGFCKKCGVHLFRAFQDKDQGLEINFHCIDFSSPMCSQPCSKDDESVTHTMSIETDSTSAYSEKMKNQCNDYCYARKLDTRDEEDVYPWNTTPSTFMSSCTGSQEITVIPIDLASSSTSSSSSIDDCSVSPINRLDYHFNSRLPRHSSFPQGICNDGNMDMLMKESRPMVKSLFPTNSSSKNHDTISSHHSSIHQMKKYMNKYLSSR